MKCPYFTVTLSGRVRLHDLLAHLYVLIPVLDDKKHYWVSEDEIEKLLLRGEGWLAAHPERELIASRYLAHQPSLTREALRQLVAEEDAGDPDEREAAHDAEEAAVEERISLDEQRIGAVVAALRASGASGCSTSAAARVGCWRLVKDQRSPRSSASTSRRARSRSRAGDFASSALHERQRERLRLLHGSLTYRDAGSPGSTRPSMEVIEHLEPPRLPAFERVALRVRQARDGRRDDAERRVQRPLRDLPAGHFRHRDHRFEWTRAEFGAWADGVAERFGYGFASCRSVPTIPRSGRRRRWRSSADEVTLPELSLVVMVGTTGSGKSTFARTNFKPTEVLSSDFFRGLVADDENDQAATGDAFDALHYVAGKRLAAGRLTVIDATNVQQDARKPLVALARKFHVLPVAIVLDIPERICEERNRSRPDRQFGPHVLARQRRRSNAR